MRAIFLILIIGLLVSCDSENAWDCVQAAGTTLEYEVVVPNFERILVKRDVELTVSEGAEFRVVVQTGENLVSDIDVNVSGNRLILADNNSCNLVREYGLTRIHVTAPQLTEIRNSSQFEVSSSSVLNYDNLVLISEDFNDPDSFNVGGFRMDLVCDELQIVSNGRASFYLSGSANNLNIGFFGGIGRFEGESLISEVVQVYHRGSNDMIVNPQQSLSGELRSTGDLISVNVPPEVQVVEFYTGQLIFDD